MEWETPQKTYESPAYTTPSPSAGTGMRRRVANPNVYSSASFSNDVSSPDTKYGNKSINRNLKKLDIFPKVEKDLTVKTDNGGFMTIVAYFLTIIIVLAEIYNYRSLNNTVTQHMSVDKSLGKKMRVDLNMTFPAIHCDDVHIDIMDIAGDAHNDVEDTMKKIPLHLDGSKLTQNEIRVEVNMAHEKDKEALEAMDKSLAADYCGPCYGAPPADEDEKCCNHCDDVLEAYKKMSWDYDGIKHLAEQCVREGKTKPKKVKTGEGCQIAGFMEFGRVNGNFHIAMGEGVERNGQHIHTFLPEDVKMFNSSHIIHELRFGPVHGAGKYSEKNEQTSLEGVSKIVTEKNGVTGMFQYFIKVVPTSYKGKKIVKEIDPNFDVQNKEPILETNRYFVTERFNPLMEIDDEHWELGDMFADDDEEEIAAAHVGGKNGMGHDKHEHHLKQQSILPGVFFIYQVYPFTVEISKEEVPLTHLLIRILATIGGVFTIIGWLDTLAYSKRLKKGGPR